MNEWLEDFLKVFFQGFIIEIYTPSMATFEELLMLKGANSLALEFKSSYFAVPI